MAFYFLKISHLNYIACRLNKLIYFAKQRLQVINIKTENRKEMPRLVNAAIFQQNWSVVSCEYKLRIVRT